MMPGMTFLCRKKDGLFPGFSIKMIGITFSLTGYRKVHFSLKCKGKLLIGIPVVRSRRFVC
jgi:hypothetical protein